MRFLIIIAFFFGSLTVEANAQFGGLKNPLDAAKSLTGIGDQGQESGSAADSQDALVKRYVAAISGLLDAQYNFALAFDLKDEAAKIQDAKNLINNDTSKNGLKTATNVSSETNKLIMSKTGEQTALSAEGKVYYAKALPDYARGAYNMGKLAPEASKWLKNAQAEVKGAGIAGALNIKKKLDIGLFIAPKIPGLIKTFASNTNKLVSYGKKNDLDTSGADEANFD